MSDFLIFYAFITGLVFFIGSLAGVITATIGIAEDDETLRGYSVRWFALALLGGFWPLIPAVGAYAMYRMDQPSKEDTLFQLEREAGLR